jgi:O-antigen/teichoic acid export membrane protein
MGEVEITLSTKLSGDASAKKDNHLPIMVQLHRSVLSDGTFVFLADALILPTGLLTVALLTRQFGPDGYGAFAIVASLVAWMEWGITSLFSRLTIQLVAEGQEWQTIAAALVRWHVLAGAIGFILLAALANPIATVMGDPTLNTYLVLFAIDIPIFALAQAHRNILTGIGKFRARAFASTGRWVGRLLLIGFLLYVGLSLWGAILGSVGASIIELAICRLYIHPSVFGTRQGRIAIPHSAFPLMLSAGSLTLYSKLDLFAVKMLGGTAAEAGFYAAAQNLSILPGLAAQVFSGLLLSTLSRTIRDGDVIAARKLAQRSLAVSLGLLPIAGLFAGAAPAITDLCFGITFRPAAPLLAILIFGAVAYGVISVATAILTARGQAKLMCLLTAPVVPLAIIGHLAIIPHFGSRGAAFVTTCAGLSMFLACLIALWRHWDLALRPNTVMRSAVLCAVGYVLAGAGGQNGLWLILKLTALGIVATMIFWYYEAYQEHPIRRWGVPS